MSEKGAGRSGSAELKPIQEEENETEGDDEPEIGLSLKGETEIAIEDRVQLGCDFRRWTRS